jgi:hypothetical protein
VVIRIKGWEKFQHFKDRKPPWVKLYRDILDDLEWYELDPKAAKALVMMWLIASESDGYLPDTKKLAFRLRMSESATLDVISKLSHWLDQDDIEVISTGYQDDRPETETETETDISVIADLFDRFWTEYPRKVARPEALKAFKRTKPTEESLAAMLAAILRQGLADKCAKGESRFVPHPSTWLNQERWRDQESADKGASAWWLPAGFSDRYEAENSRCTERNAHQFRDGKRIQEAA